MADLLTIVTAADLEPFGNIAEQVERVAWANGITADPEPIDTFAADVTRLCDRVVTFDRTEMLLIKLTRAGIVDDGQSFALHAAHLAQKKSALPSVDTAVADITSDAFGAENAALETAALRALEQRRTSGAVLVYELDGWMVHEYPGGRIERLAPRDQFRAADFPHPSPKPSDAPVG